MASYWQPMPDILRYFNQYRDDFYQKVTSENPGPMVGWLCTYTPEEILHAAGLYPFRVMGSHEPIMVADSCLHKNVCPYIRSVLEQNLKKNGPHPEGLVFVNSCDGMRRLCDAWQHYLPQQYSCMLELPRSSGDGPLRLFLSSLEKWVKSLQEHFNLQVTESNLRSSIKKYNRRRVLLHNLYDLRKEHPPKTTGWEVLNVINTAMTAPIDPFCQNLSLLIQELNLNSRFTHLSGDLPRVLVSGNIVDDLEMIKTIEESGCVVVADDLCSGTRFFWNLVDEGGDPLEALARSYLQKPPCMRTSDFERRMAFIEELVEEFRVDAVIYLSIKFCDNALFEFPMIRQSLTRMGIPVLFLESEYTSVPKGQIRTRVEAFLETL